MRWWIIKNGQNTGEIFDDGIAEATPGRVGFDRDVVDAEVTRRGSEWSADYMGPTDGPPTVE